MPVWQSALNAAEQVFAFTEEAAAQDTVRDARDNGTRGLTDYGGIMCTVMRVMGGLRGE